jgi:hypothetical protein
MLFGVTECVRCVLTACRLQFHCMQFSHAATWMEFGTYLSIILVNICGFRENYSR